MPKSIDFFQFVLYNKESNTEKSGRLPPFRAFDHSERENIMTKKLLAILLALLTVVSVTACSDKKGNENLKDGLEKTEEVVRTSAKVGEGVVYFENYDSDSVTITGYKGPDHLHDLTIPTVVRTGEDESTDKKVTRIANGAFYSVSSLRSVVVPEGIEIIGDYAFAMCVQMESVTLPASLKELGRGAFLGSGLKSLPLPTTCALTEIPDWAFSECEGLTEITVPSYIKTVGYGAFALCTNVAKITIPEGVTTVKNQAFQNTLALAELHLPSTFTNTDPFEDGVFTGSKVLYRENIHCPEGDAGAAARAYADKMHLTKKPADQPTDQQ